MKQKELIIGVALLAMSNLVGCGSGSLPEESNVVMAEQDNTEEQALLQNIE